MGFGTTLNVKWKVSNKELLCICLVYGKKLTNHIKIKGNHRTPGAVQVAWGPSGLPLSFCREGNGRHTISTAKGEYISSRDIGVKALTEFQLQSASLGLSAFPSVCGKKQVWPV